MKAEQNASQRHGMQKENETPEWTEERMKRNRREKDAILGVIKVKKIESDNVRDKK